MLPGHTLSYCFLQDKDIDKGAWRQQPSWTDETADGAAQEGERYGRSESRRTREANC